jgi:hypothetical protein
LTDFDTVMQGASGKTDEWLDSLLGRGGEQATPVTSKIWNAAKDDSTKQGKTRSQGRTTIGMKKKTTSTYHWQLEAIYPVL